MDESFSKGTFSNAATAEPGDGFSAVILFTLCLGQGEFQKSSYFALSHCVVGGFLSRKAMDECENPWKMFSA
jgi:hypothetical protein